MLKPRRSILVKTTTHIPQDQLDIGEDIITAHNAACEDDADKANMDYLIRHAFEEFIKANKPAESSEGAKTRKPRTSKPPELHAVQQSA